MAGRFFYMSETGQKAILTSIKCLYAEIDMAKQHTDDPELGARISNNIEFAKREIGEKETLLAATVHPSEINNALGLQIL